MGHGRTSWIALTIAAALAGCGTATGTGAGQGLSAAARGGLTTHGAAPGPGSESRPDYEDERAAIILPTPRVDVTPHHPEPLGRTEEGIVYRTRIDVTNRGGVAVRVPRVALDVEMRSPEGRRGCEVVSVTTKGEPVVLPGETVLLDARAVCPDADGPHEVVSFVELPELTGEDALVASRTVVAETR